MSSDILKLIIDQVDISENDLLAHYPRAFEQLLRDHTTGKNIFWATKDYESLGPEYSCNSQILPHLITGDNNKIITPRVKKNKMLQSERSHTKAEIFTPSWICNMQNNIIDDKWFGRKGIFNVNRVDCGVQTWETNRKKIKFPKGKTWNDYVDDNRLEITCGEAPYITSRYDTTTGVFIKVKDRIGIIDRKLRVINENVDKSGDWLKAAQRAYRSTYAYEWHGDSLLLAREALLYTFIENYVLKFNRLPQEKSITFMAYIISWNVWQMDGLKYVIPDSCKTIENTNLLKEVTNDECPGCKHKDPYKHNGIYCIIKDWKERKKSKQKLRFVDLVVRNGNTSW